MGAVARQESLDAPLKTFGYFVSLQGQVGRGEGAEGCDGKDKWLHA